MSGTVATFRIEQIEGTLVLIPQRDALDARYESFHHEYNEVHRMIGDLGITNLVVDFAEVTFFSSTLLGALIELARRIRREGGEAILCGLDGNVREVFDNVMELEKVDHDFFNTSHASREAALETLRVRS